GVDGDGPRRAAIAIEDASLGARAAVSRARGGGQHVRRGAVPVPAHVAVAAVGVLGARSLAVAVDAEAAAAIGGRQAGDRIGRQSLAGAASAYLAAVAVGVRAARIVAHAAQARAARRALAGAGAGGLGRTCPSLARARRLTGRRRTARGARTSRALRAVGIAAVPSVKLTASGEQAGHGDDPGNQQSTGRHDGLAPPVSGIS